MVRWRARRHSYADADRVASVPPVAGSDPSTFAVVARREIEPTVAVDRATIRALAARGHGRGRRVRGGVPHPATERHSLSTAADRMVINVPTDLCPIIQGTAITIAPSVAELHALLGPPSRIAEPAVRAPVGHRNNHFHVYDAAGLYFQEHHYTRRIAGCEVVFRPEELSVPFAARQPYSGQLRLGSRDFSADADLADLVRGCEITFEPSLVGWLVARREQFSAILTCRGAKLPSGQRSRTLRLVSVALGWPHDPWGTPEGGG